LAPKLIINHYLDHLKFHFYLEIPIFKILIIKKALIHIRSFEQEIINSKKRLKLWKEKHKEIS